MYIYSYICAKTDLSMRASISFDFLASQKERSLQQAMLLKQELSKRCASAEVRCCIVFPKGIWKGSHTVDGQNPAVPIIRNIP